MLRLLVCLTLLLLPSMLRPSLAFISCGFRKGSSRLFSTAELPGDEHFMRLALRHAQFAFREKEIPVGAVLVDEHGSVLATARNSVETSKDATAHAEVAVMRKAAQMLGNWRLANCTLYTTLEPCAMCFSAAQSFRIRRLVYGAFDKRLGALGSWVDLTSQPHPFHKVEVTGGVLEEEASTLLRRFFQLRRREKQTGVTDDWLKD